MPSSPSSTQARLARLGAVETERAAADLARIPHLSDEAVDDLADAADVDMLLSSLVELDAAVVARLDEDADFRRRLYAVLGMSRELGNTLARHPEDAEFLVHAPQTGPFDLPVLEIATIRRANRQRLLSISAADLSGDERLENTMAHLADLADATLEAALALARLNCPDDAVRTRLAIVAMGKSGARELNYVSDVDVLFVASPAPGIDETAAVVSATALAQAVIRICSAPCVEGDLWAVDANLRPEGRDGPLVRTLPSYVEYYDRWANPWEFQALLKARPAAGDRELGTTFVRQTAPYVWAAADGAGFVDYVRDMRRRVESNIPAREAERALKLGAGGLRDVEFSVQLLQLVHGRSDVMLREPATLDALEALATWGYVGRADAATMAESYRFLRELEHRLQLLDLRRVQVVPTDEPALRRIGRSMGHRDDAAVEVVREWRRHATEVRRLHEKLFYRPLLDAVARLDATDARLSLTAAEERMRVLGYLDPGRAMRHLEALTSGVTRRAAIQRTLLPLMLEWFAESPDPDAGLLAFRTTSEALGSSPWYLRLLRDDVSVAKRMAQVISSSRYVVDLLSRAPDSVVMLTDEADLEPRGHAALASEAKATVARHRTSSAAMTALQTLRRRELLRISMGQVLGRADVESVGSGLSALADVTIDAALAVAVRDVEAARGSPLPTRIAVIALGSFGGRELGYGSDADVLFVHQPDAGAEQEAGPAALEVARVLRSLLGGAGIDPPLQLDVDLRPEGKHGPLVRTLASFAAYYERWSLPWETQALLRATPGAGDTELGQRFIDLIDPIRYPIGGIDDAAIREIRRLKARMETERLPRGADPAMHTKLGRGGLSDVEWVAQLLTLRHAGDVPGLRTTGTVAALEAAMTAGVLRADDGQALIAAWRTASTIRSANILATGRADDLVATDRHRLAQVAHLLGYPAGHADDLIEDYRRATRRARTVVERVFYE